MWWLIGLGVVGLLVFEIVFGSIVGRWLHSLDERHPHA